ncbi:MAG: Holliday junction branch migration protein RuvA [Gammaproteobacteria bacterium]|nr:Holliday junction branch migration protein RuvA [Gammaproteobacteria bacterium]
MIGRLRGEIVFKQPPYLMVDVKGVGYELESPMSTFYNLPPEGDQVTLFTHLAVREDAHVLYGFANESERALFRILLRVSGVGAKMALAILSGMSAGEFASCIQSNDTAALMRLPGIGKKTAERLVIELRDRLERSDSSISSQLHGSTNSAVVGTSPVTDAVGALVALGYKPAEANRMVRAVQSEGLESEAIIRAALKSVAMS